MKRNCGLRIADCGKNFAQRVLSFFLSTIRFPLSAILVLFFSACRQDMYNQPRTKPLRANPFFADGKSARPLPPHTVSRDALPENSPELTGKNPDGTLVNLLPIALKPGEEMRAFLERGRDRFDIFCAVCHDRTGSGNGMIVQRGFPQPPSYHVDRLRNAPIGHFYDVITNGYGVMYPYAVRVPDARDRWAIAAYIRALQLARNASPNDAPPDAQSQLNTALSAQSTP